jgi:hypothetical protein
MVVSRYWPGYGGLFALREASEVPLFGFAFIGEEFPKPSPSSRNSVNQPRVTKRPVTAELWNTRIFRQTKHSRPASAGDNLIESTARALLRERIEATPWFRIRMTQEQRRAAIEREVDAYWHLFIADATQRLLGPGEASQHPKH